MVYGAALTLALTGNLGSATAIVVLIVGAVLLPVALFIVRRRIWTPLTEIEHAIRRVSEGDLGTQVPVTRDDELGTVGTHFNHMTRVLRDRAEEQGRFAGAGEKRTAAVNMNDVVRSALDLVSYRFTIDEITIGGRLDPQLPTVVGDANRLEQVIVNLLSNALDALRSVKPPRHLNVDSFIDDTGSRVCVTVTDNGPGVAPEIAQRLFRPFASTKGIRGTGLGLYISRQLVREAEGELDLVKRAEPGARFLVWLPTARQAVPAAPAAAPSRVSPTPKKS